MYVRRNTYACTYVSPDEGIGDGLACIPLGRLRCLELRFEHLCVLIGRSASLETGLG